MHEVQKKIIILSKKKNIDELGYRRLGALIGVEHPQKVKWHLQKLLRDGHLVRGPRGKLIPPNQQPLFKGLISIPILGRANCGEPLEFAESLQDGTIQVSRNCLPKSSLNKCFAVRAVGDSMNNTSIEGRPINNGDLVIVDSTKTAPSSGDVVLISIDGLATIKKFDMDQVRQRITLLPQSKSPHNPIIIHASDMSAHQVHGKVIDVIPAAA